MFEVKIETSFSSAHHLLNYKGKCENMHGHNWKVEVYARGEKLNKSNILIDFKELKNESPSSEFIAKFIYYKAKERFSAISRVDVWETTTSRASYFEE